MQVTSVNVAVSKIDKLVEKISYQIQNYIIV